MSDRSTAARPTARPLTLAVDVVLFTPRGRELAALFVPAGPASRPRERLLVPSDTLRPDETLDTAAVRIARDASGAVPSLLEQAGAIGGAKRQQDLASIAITYFGLTPDAGTRKLGEWIALSETDDLAGRAREQLDLALGAMRARVDQQPIAFRLLPAAFTLSELQAVYELLLGRRLHKASFRRALHASALVEPTDEWRSEGRGRPAQLFRYAPPRRRRQRRGIRFDLIA
jgi:8-oxo-dGTP diphosphatase